MKNYVIGALAVIILVLGSLFYKHRFSPPPRNQFPVIGEMKNVDAEVPLFLYVFFSKHNCTDCLEIIRVLNNAPPHMPVLGLVPDRELRDEKNLRAQTGATFPLINVSKFRKYSPWYSPSLIGVSPDGDILFVLPGVPGQREYLLSFLNSLYEKVYPLFLENKIQKQKNKGD